MYTLDAAGKVSAFSTSGGAPVWRVSTTPPNEKDQEGFGGGLAADGGRIYAGTGFGYVVALDARTGNKLWEKNVESPVRTSPTAAAERVFVVTKEGQVYCLSGSDGTELWNFRGMPERASLLSNASPAVDGDIVVVPYPTGDLVALRVSDGQPVWSESLARTRTGSSMAAMSDTARPGHRRRHRVRRRPCRPHGRHHAEDGRAAVVADGAEQSRRRGWPATSVFVVDTTGQLMAITRRDGKIQWTAKLPGANTWSGPVLAGNRLWLTSNKGQLVGVDATTGRVETHAGPRPARSTSPRWWPAGACSCSPTRPS